MPTVSGFLRGAIGPTSTHGRSIAKDTRDGEDIDDPLAGSWMWRSRSELRAGHRPSQRADQDRRAEFLCPAGRLHGALPQRMAARARRDQRQGRRSRPQDRDRLPRRRRDHGRRHPRRRRARHPRGRLAAVRLVPVECRRRHGGFRQPEEDRLHRRRAPDRCHHHGAGQPLHLPHPAQQLHAGRHAGGPGQGLRREALGHRRAELRIRPVGRRGVQATHQGARARRRDRRRAISGPRQDRGGRHGLGARAGQARRHLQRALRPRPHPVRPRGQHPRPVREARPCFRS